MLLIFDVSDMIDTQNTGKTCSRVTQTQPFTGVTFKEEFHLNGIMLPNHKISSINNKKQQEKCTFSSFFIDLLMAFRANPEEPDVRYGLL